MRGPLACTAVSAGWLYWRCWAVLIKADIGGYGWRSVFLINLPICLFVLLTARRFVPETHNLKRVPVDVSGTLLLAGAIGCLMLALALGPLLHWSWPCLLLLALFPLFSASAASCALRLEAAGGSPLLPPSLLRLSSVRFGLTLAVLFFSCWSGFMFAVALTLQSGIGMTAFQSGNAFIALGAAYFIGSMRTTRMVERYGKRATLLSGCAIQMVGLVALIATLQLKWPQVGIATLIPATALIGFGQSFCQHLLPHWHERGAASSGRRAVRCCLPCSNRRWDWDRCCSAACSPRSISMVIIWQPSAVRWRWSC